MMVFAGSGGTVTGQAKAEYAATAGGRKGTSIRSIDRDVLTCHHRPAAETLYRWTYCPPPECLEKDARVT